MVDTSNRIVARVHVAVLGALALAAVLNGGSLRRSAERLPISDAEDFAGRWRSVSLAVSTGLERLQHALAVDSVQQWVEAHVSAEPPPAPATETSAPSAPPPSAPVAPELTPTVVAAVAPQGSGPALEPPKPAPTETPRPEGASAGTREPTEARPFRVLLVGDSLMEPIQTTMALLAKSNKRLQAVRGWRYSTGLVRADYYDWAKEMPALVAAQHPDLVIVLIGGNDGQAMEGPKHTVLAIGSPAWQAVVAERMRRILAAVDAAGAETWWLALPAMARANVEQARRSTNEAVVQVAAGFRSAHVLDTRPIFDTPEGGYTEVIDDPRKPGRKVSARNADGVHMSVAGADILTRSILATMAERISPALAVPGDSGNISPLREIPATRAAPTAGATP